MREGDLGVERHDVVQAVVGVAVLALGVAQLPGQAEGAGGGVGDRHLARQIDAIQPRCLVGVAQDHELILERHGGGRIGHVVPLFGVDVVVHARVVGRGLELPGFIRRVPVQRGRERMGGFVLQIRIAEVAVAITDEVVHLLRHHAGRPGIALVQIGRAGLHRVAELDAAGVVRGIARDRRHVPVVVGLAAIARVEGAGVVHHHVVTLHLAGVGRHPLVARADQGHPPRIEVALPLAEHAGPIALAVVDVLEGVGCHAAYGGGLPLVIEHAGQAGGRRRPPVVETVALIFAAQAQHVGLGQIQARHELGAGVVAAGIHRHAGGDHAGRCAVDVLLVVTEVHVVIDLLVIGAGLQLAPAELAQIAQVDTALVVVEHVHALVGIQLVRDVLRAELGFEQLAGAADGDAQLIVVGFIGGGADLIPRQRVAGPAGFPVILEVATGVVIVGLGDGAGIVEAEPVGGVGGVEMAVHGIAVAAVTAADLALGQALLAVLGEFRQGRLDHDGAADRISADAHRRDAGIDADEAHVARVDVGEHRIHVVGTGGHQIHAV